MALIDCHECGSKVSTEALTCPGCGAKVKVTQPKKKRPVLKWLFIFVVLIVFTQFLSKGLQQQSASPPQPPVVAAAKTEADKQADIQFKREKAAAITAEIIRHSARNPKSVEWVGILANEDASVMCFEIRAENGFGGMTVEDFTVVKGQIKSSDAAWNKNCVNKSLFDVKDGVIRMLELVSK